MEVLRKQMQQRGTAYCVNAKPVPLKGYFNHQRSRSIRVHLQFLGDSFQDKDLRKLGFSKSRRPIEARLEMGEVSLTASIFQILIQFLFRVMARNFTLQEQISEDEVGQIG
jgi:hypothetical protein